MPSSSPSCSGRARARLSDTRTTRPSDSTTACSDCTVPVTPASAFACDSIGPLGATQSLPEASAAATAPATSTATMRGMRSITAQVTRSRNRARCPGCRRRAPPAPAPDRRRPAQLLGDLVGDRAVALDRQRVAADRRGRAVRDRPPPQRALGVGQQRPARLGRRDADHAAADGLDRVAAARAGVRLDQAHAAQAGAGGVGRERHAQGLVAGACDRHRRVLDLGNGQGGEAVAPAAGGVPALILEQHPAQAELLSQRGRRYSGVSPSPIVISRSRVIGSWAAKRDRPRPESLLGLSDDTRPYTGATLDGVPSAEHDGHPAGHRHDGIAPPAPQALERVGDCHPASIPLDAPGLAGVYFRT